MNVGEKSITKYFYRFVKEKIYKLGLGTGHTYSIDWHRLQVQVYTLEKSEYERAMIAKDICKKILEKRNWQCDKIILHDDGDMIYCEIIPSMIPCIDEDKENDDWINNYSRTASFDKVKTMTPDGILLCLIISIGVLCGIGRM